MNYNHTNFPPPLNLFRGLTIQRYQTMNSLLQGFTIFSLNIHHSYNSISSRECGCHSANVPAVSWAVFLHDENFIAHFEVLRILSPFLPKEGSSMQHIPSVMLTRWRFDLQKISQSEIFFKFLKIWLKRVSLLRSSWNGCLPMSH